jgi:hypothetical protein
MVDGKQQPLGQPISSQDPANQNDDLSNQSQRPIQIFMSRETLFPTYSIEDSRLPHALWASVRASVL